MSDRISQLSLVHDAVQDRLLLLISTRLAKEFRISLTRRFVKTMWPALVKVLEADPAVRNQTDPASRQAVLSFQHEAATANVDFKSEYKAPTDVDSRPLGDEPLLVNAAQIRRHQKGSITLSMRTPDKIGLELSFDTRILHSLCRLLVETTNQADWQLGLELGAGHAAEPVARQLN